MRFDELYLSDNVLDALDDMRFETCTPIQEKCIPEILDGHDIVGVAQTGTGKTAAYLLPILSLIDDGLYPDDAINCIIMSPTRELAQQIDQAMQGFSYYINNVSSVAVYGGNDGNRYDQETKGLQMGADVIIATPGRLISHINMGHADLSRVSFFVLDEADRMLDMGFSDDIMMIAKQLPQQCQTIMFSATMPTKIEQLAKSLLNDPVEIKIAVSKPAAKIRQGAYVCHENQKLGILRHLFHKNQLKRVIVFGSSKLKVHDINRALRQININSGEMHSNLSQSERDDMMYKFKTGQIDVLIATDIVARGIDIDDIAMVINYDVPHDSEDYVHRIGRTARADRDGRALTLVRGREIADFMKIEKFLGYAVDKLQLPDGLGEAPEYKAMKATNGRGRRHDNQKGRKNVRRNKKTSGNKAVANKEKTVSPTKETNKKPRKKRNHNRSKTVDKNQENN